MKTILIHFSEKIRASAWTIPTILALSALALAQFTLWADETLTSVTWDWITLASPEGGKVLLSTIAGSMLAIAGVSFSSIMVTMTLASQQFGPRLLRNFIKDNFSQVVLGSFIGTFIYSLLILRKIESDRGGLAVPQLSTLVALVLALGCLALFIRFVHRVMSDIQAEEVSRDAFEKLCQTIEDFFPDMQCETEQRRTEQDLDGWGIMAGKTGYLQAIDVESLVTQAKGAGAVFVVDCKPGHFVTARQVIIRVVEGPSMEDVEEPVISKVQSAFFVGAVGTPEQDFEYGFRQLVEIALRALSPGINDPFTAMNCIDYLGAGLESAFARPTPASVHRDGEGNIRVLSWPSSYRGLVEVAFNQIRQASVDRCDVSCRLLETLTRLIGTSEKKEQHEALLVQARLISEDVPRHLQNDHDRKALSSRFSKLIGISEEEKGVSWLATCEDKVK